MKNLTFAFLVISFLISSCKKDTDDISLETTEDTTTTVVDTTTSTEDDPSNKVCKLTREYRYEYSDFGDYNSELLYSYDSEGLQTGYTYNANGNLSLTQKDFTHNINGQLTGYTEYNSDDVKNQTVKYTYDANGNLIKEELLGTYSTVYEWTYDDLNRENSYKYYANGNLSQERKNYKYDSQNNVTYYEEFNENESKVSRTATFVFDSNGNKIKEEFVSDSYSSQFEWVYDSSNKETSYKYYVNGNLSQEHKNYKYDSLGNITYYEIFDNVGVISSYVEQSFSCF